MVAVGARFQGQVAGSTTYKHLGVAIHTFGRQVPHFQFEKSHARIFHVTDRYICMSVVAKGRSGSRQLNKVLRQLNAHLLGFGIYIYIIIAHVESSENPTDHASRQMAVCAAPFKSRARP